MAKHKSKMGKYMLLGVTGIIWLLYGLYELLYIAKACPLNCIRVDLLIIWPSLIVITTIAYNKLRQK